MEEKNKLDVVRVRLAPDIPLYSDKAADSVKAAIEILKGELSTYDREVFGILNLNTKGIPINFNVVSIGTLDASIVHPRETFKASILSNANSFIAIHNHPSGIAEPSFEDLVLTKRLYDAGTLLGIKMIDHIIVGNDEFFSFAEHDVLGVSAVQAEKIIGVREEPLEYNKDVFRNKNGSIYSVIASNDKDALLKNQRTGDYVIACGLDRISGEWEHGIYYGNTPDQLAFASLEFNKRGEVNPDFGEKVFEILGYEEIFKGLMSLEFDQWKKLDCKSKESIYQEFFSDDNMMLIDQDLFNKVESSIYNLKEQVQLYAKSEFDDWQMREIREGFKNGLTQEEVQFYAKPEFNHAQMIQIRRGFEKGLTYEQVQLYAKPEFNNVQMYQIRF